MSLRESDSRTDQDASGRKEGNEAKFFFKKLIHCIIHHKYILSFAREREMGAFDPVAIFATIRVAHGSAIR